MTLKEITARIESISEFKSAKAKNELKSLTSMMYFASLYGNNANKKSHKEFFKKLEELFDKKEKIIDDEELDIEEINKMFGNLNGK